ncbi:IS110 family transposase [Micromonospora sp. CPCC 206061]|uniref:IS110 family transposase n=1 Tax=Micromonospora sp. CPCC 206061 TaxID=3122410 RepID=UPI002FF24090
MTCGYPPILELIPGGAKKFLTRGQASYLLRTAPAPVGILAQTRHQLARELIDELAMIDTKIRAADKRLRQLVTATGSSLAELNGIGPSGAARLIGDIGNIARFATAAHFASWNGTAPIEASSGDQKRHRLSRAGNRRINRVLHIMAVVQLRHDTPGRAYYQRRLAEGKTTMEALRPRLSIGIGAGNPGGGTFHAIVFANEDGHAFSLTDEPFERVPQGGRDLTAAQARAHEDLPFVWWVTDHVMQHDRRAWWMRHWLLGTTCIQTPEVFERHEPVLLVSHDADDGIWQLIGASDADGSAGKVGHLHHAVDEDPSLIDVLDLPPGRSAVRAGVEEPWSSRL